MADNKNMELDDSVMANASGGLIDLPDPKYVSDVIKTSIENMDVTTVGELPYNLGKEVIDTVVNSPKPKKK